MRTPLRISKFERNILFAILMCAVTPFVITIVFIGQIAESRLAQSLHSPVREQLEASAVFYKEFFDAKKREFAARAEAMSKDSILIAAVEEERADDVKERLEQIVADNKDLRSARVLKPSGEALIELEGPADRQGPDFVPRKIALPLGVGDAHTLEVELVLPSHYLQDREKAEEIAQLYATTLVLEADHVNSYFIAYVAIVSVVVLLALGLGYYLARRVTKRIARLASATERVAKGESGFAIPLGGNDEITELSASFNRMIEEVADARDRIVYLEKVSGWQEFARRLAHEIKNPLTPIRLAIQELRRRAPEGDPAFKRLVDESADVVEDEIRALTRLVDEFSQFARLPEVTPSHVELRSFLEEFLGAHHRFEPDAEVLLTVPDKPVPAAIDRVLMRRVLSNLATNAIQAAGKGKAKLWLTCSVIEPSDSVEIRLEDNGPGIPSQNAEKIFEPYFTTKSDGTGLGLAIVKKIVLQHGGTISLKRPQLGTGASFVIVLPAPSRVENVALSDSDLPIEKASAQAPSAEPETPAPATDGLGQST